jgi:phenylacetate-CoA ligase
MSLISLINAFPYGNPAEKGFYLYKKAPAGLLKSIEAGQFPKVMKWVYEKSAFYKREFNKRGIKPENVKVPADLGDFFTTPEDIRRNVDEFVCMKADTAYESTGTTSKKTKRVYFSRNEVKEAGWSGAVGLWGVGLRPEDRVASAFDYSFWVSGPVLTASCEVLGCFHVEAGRLDPADFYERLADYRLNVLVGDPSWIVRLSEIAEKRGAWPGMKLILGGGENLTEEARRYVERVWKCDFLLSYGQTEAFGAIGMESRAKEGYHLNEFHNAFEIVDSDADGYGELVYTNLNRRVMPLIRYRSGDITRFIDGPSKSGLPGRRIEKLRGRVDEWTVTAMGNIAPWMFESVFSRIPGAGEWQIEVAKDGPKDSVTFHVETDGVDEAAMKSRVLEEIRKEFSDAFKITEMGLLHIGLKTHAKGALRTGRKLKRIVDNRKF